MSVILTQFIELPRLRPVSDSSSVLFSLSLSRFRSDFSSRTHRIIYHSFYRYREMTFERKAEYTGLIEFHSAAGLTGYTGFFFCRRDITYTFD